MAASGGTNYLDIARKGRLLALDRRDTEVGMFFPDEGECLSAAFLSAKASGHALLRPHQRDKSGL